MYAPDSRETLIKAMRVGAAKRWTAKAQSELYTMRGYGWIDLDKFEESHLRYGMCQAEVDGLKEGVTLDYIYRIKDALFDAVVNLFRERYPKGQMTVEQFKEMLLATGLDSYMANAIWLKEISRFGLWSDETYEVIKDHANSELKKATKQVASKSES